MAISKLRVHSASDFGTQRSSSLVGIGLAACGGGGGGNSAGSPPSTAMSVQPSAIVLGQSAQLTWTASAGTDCAASGGWSGSEPTGGTQTRGAECGRHRHLHADVLGRRLWWQFEPVGDTDGHRAERVLGHQPGRRHGCHRCADDRRQPGQRLGNRVRPDLTGVGGQQPQRDLDAVRRQRQAAAFLRAARRRTAAERGRASTSMRPASSSIRPPTSSSRRGPSRRPQRSSSTARAG
jgi:hypothetical protein